MHSDAILLVVPLQVPLSWKLTIILGISAILISSIFTQTRHRRSSSHQTTPYSFPAETFNLCPSLLSQGELVFLNALEQAIGNQFRIAMKVRLGDLVKVPGHNSQAVTARNKINQKHVDFVLCSVATVKPILVIELDDKSHAAPVRQARDAFVDECLNSVGLQILHIPCQRSYNVRQLAMDIHARI